MGGVNEQYKIRVFLHDRSFINVTVSDCTTAKELRALVGKELERDLKKLQLQTSFFSIYEEAQGKERRLPTEATIGDIFRGWKVLGVTPIPSTAPSLNSGEELETSKYGKFLWKLTNKVTFPLNPQRQASRSIYYQKKAKYVEEEKKKIDPTRTNSNKSFFKKDREKEERDKKKSEGGVWFAADEQDLSDASEGTESESSREKLQVPPKTSGSNSPLLNSPHPPHSPNEKQKKSTAPRSSEKSRSTSPSLFSNLSSPSSPSPSSAISHTSRTTSPSVRQPPQRNTSCPTTVHFYHPRAMSSGYGTPLHISHASCPLPFPSTSASGSNSSSSSSPSSTSSSNSMSNPSSPRGQNPNLCERNAARLHDATEMRRQVSDASFVRRKPSLNETPNSRKKSFIGVKNLEREGTERADTERQRSQRTNSFTNREHFTRNGRQSEESRPRTTGETERDRGQTASEVEVIDISLKRFSSYAHKESSFLSPPRRGENGELLFALKSQSSKSIPIHFLDESSVQVMIDDAVTADHIIPYLPHPKISIKSSEFALFEVDSFSERRIADSERLGQVIRKWDHLGYPRKFLFKEVEGTISFHFADGSQETMEISISSVCKDVIKHAIEMRGLKGGVSNWKVILSYGEKEIDIEEMEKLLELQELMEFNKAKFSGAKFWIKENSSMGTIRVRLEDGTFKTLSVTSTMITTDVVKLLEKKLILPLHHSYSLYEVDYVPPQERKLLPTEKPLLRQIEWREKTKNMKDYVSFCFHSPSFSPLASTSSPSSFTSYSSSPSSSPSPSSSFSGTVTSHKHLPTTDGMEERRKKKTLSRVLPSLPTGNISTSPSTVYSSSSSSSSSSSASSASPLLLSPRSPSVSAVSPSPRGNRPAAFTQGDIYRKVAIPSWFKKDKDKDKDKDRDSQK